MIKDELKQEAEEWLCNNLHSASEEDFIKAMVEIAEPREKRIAELKKDFLKACKVREQVCKEAEQACERKDKRIAELEEKNKVITQNLEDTEIINAELKEKLGAVQMQKAGEKSDLVWKLKTANEQKAEQLTKAKEELQNIIKVFVGDLPRSLVYFDKEQLEAVKKAEQFLKDSEVGK